jgi:excisionase family DNA binding protein
MLQIPTVPLKGRLLTVDEVSQLLGVSAAWVYQHSCGARQPRLPSVKLGRAVRFRPESVQEFVCQMERCV